MLASLTVSTLLFQPLGSNPAHPELSSRMAKLKSECDKIATGFNGKFGYYVKNLKSGESISIRGDELFPSASTIKTAIMVETILQIEEGKLSWSDKLAVPPIGKRNMSMWVAHLQEGAKVNIEGLTNLMMNVSDNTATVMLADKVGVEAIEARMNKWGLRGTACTINVPASNARLTKLRTDFRNMGVTTPADMGRLLELIHLRKTGASPAASERMIRMMSHQYWDDFFASVLPPNIVVCSKVGALERSRSDTAIVYGPTPYIITAYTDDAKDRSWANNNEGHVALRKLSAAVWKALNPGHPYTPPKGDDLWFPTGAGVEGD